MTTGPPTFQGCSPVTFPPTAPLGTTNLQAPGPEHPSWTTSSSSRTSTSSSLSTAYILNRKRFQSFGRPPPSHLSVSPWCLSTGPCLTPPSSKPVRQTPILEEMPQLSKRERPHQINLIFEILSNTAVLYTLYIYIYIYILVYASLICTAVCVAFTTLKRTVNTIGGNGTWRQHDHGRGRRTDH